MKLWKKVKISSNNTDPGTEVVPLWRVLSMLEDIASKADYPSEEIKFLCKEYAKIMVIDSSRAYE